MARAVRARMTVCEKRALLELADRIDPLIGGDDVRDFATKVREREGFASVEQYLNAVKRDVWWHYEQAGDPDDKPIYDAADESVYDAIRAVQRCRR